MTKQFKVAILGCGSRGATYAKYMLKTPDKYKIVALCDPARKQIDKMHDLFGLEDAAEFLDTAEFLGIDRENILTFGDNWNDLVMLSENPNGYALKGSYAERQGIRPTEFTCKEDGVARELVKIFDL